MSYLICETCGGCYSLKDGESPQDFLACECGGNLHFVESENDFIVKSSKLTCNNCGHSNNLNRAFCSECGQILKPANSLIADEHKNHQSESKIRIITGAICLAVSIFLIGLFII
jgi:DnaJ-class molecular chaperone